MKTFRIKENEAGQRLDKYLKKLLKEAPPAFLYKMLRKKNIVLNQKKANGTEKLTTGDAVTFYLSDDTFLKFQGGQPSEKTLLTQYPEHPLDVVYEDADCLIINKPAGLLSQKAKSGDVSANEYIIGYLLHRNRITPEELATFKPSVCNRLNRNTSGLLIAGTTLRGLQEWSEALKSRSLEKYYMALVNGVVEQDGHLKGYLHKNPSDNRVYISETANTGDGSESSYIETSYEVLEQYRDASLLKIHLITGRTHQIRAHLSFIGHPIIGDPKYGIPEINRSWKKKAGVSRQMLHAYQLSFPDHPEKRSITAELPEDFQRALQYAKAASTAKHKGEDHAYLSDAPRRNRL